MHPGNILVRVPRSKDRKRFFKSKPHVIFLDVGMTAELSGSDRVNLLDFFKAVARRDGRTAAECTLRLSKEQNCPNPKAYVEVICLATTFSRWELYCILTYVFVYEHYMKVHNIFCQFYIVIYIESVAYAIIIDDQD